MNNKVAIYIRYNKPTEEIQLEELLNYVKENNLDLYKVYTDICSGIIPNPPELTNLIRNSHNFNSLLVYSVDRISRNYKYFYDVKTKLFNSNVNIISLKEGAVI